MTKYCVDRVDVDHIITDAYTGPLARERERERQSICHISETTYSKIQTQIQTMAGCQKG